MTTPMELTQIAVREAEVQDVSPIAALVNLAYRVEDFFINGDRTDPGDIREHMDRGKFLVVGSPGQLSASVFFERTPRGGYFGMLSVDPACQGQGMGRRLIQEAEERAVRAGATAMELTVVNLRQELFPWYRRLGYVEAGTEPFPDPPKLKCPAHMVWMRKPLVPPGAGITMEDKR